MESGRPVVRAMKAVGVSSGSASGAASGGGLTVDASRCGGGGASWAGRAEVMRASGGGGELGRAEVMRRNKLVMQGLRSPIKSVRILSKAVDT